MRHLLVAAILFCVPLSLTAQAVHGKLTVAGGAPIAGAIVTLVDTGGTVVARVLSTPLGSYSLTTRLTGTFTLRVLRVGFPAWSSRPFTLLAGGVGEINSELPEDAIVLNELEVEGSGGACRVGASEGSATATLLEEVVKALGSAELALKDREYAFQMVRLTELLENTGRKVKSDTLVQLLYTWPFLSLSATKLRDGGFVQRPSATGIDMALDGSDNYYWFGPEASTLLAPPFLETHCFRIVADRKDSTRVGLSFAPVRGRRTADIAGTLWVDRHTLGAHSLDYEYVNVPEGFPKKGAKGGMEFLKLPNGIWILSRWTIRAPQEGARSVELAIWAEQTSWIREIRRMGGELVFTAPPRPR
jgi:hypothetical protein